MYTYGRYSLDVIAVAFLAVSLLVLIWSIRRHSASAHDEEASRILWQADDSPEITASEEVHRRPMARGVMIAVLLVVVGLLTLAPVVTIMTAKHAMEHQSSGYDYPKP